MKRILSALFVLLLSVSADKVSAEILFESGTLGPTGVSWADLQNQSIPGTNISTFAYNGVRFELIQPVISTDIGGHFVAPIEGSFFGAIIKLDGPDDFPDSGDLSKPDVLGHSLLNFPASSAEVFGELDLSLTPGWYALVFGSGLFGATTSGGAVRNGIDISSPSYIAFQPLSAFGWVNLSTFPNHRFVVKGLVVPEPGAFALMSITVAMALSFRFRNRQRKS